MKKVYWQEIRQVVKCINPEFSELVDALAPGKKFPLYVAEYRYGDIILDANKSHFIEKNAVNSITQDAEKDLSYAGNSLPFAMVMEKHFEAYIDVPKEKLTITRAVRKPGEFISYNRHILPVKKLYTPNILNFCAGCRTVFTLPPISCAHQHDSLKRDFQVSETPPDDLYDQFSIFRSLANHPELDEGWRAKVLFFSKPWIEHIVNDTGWMPLQLYFYKQVRDIFKFERNRAFYDFVVSMILKERNLRPNPFLTDIAKHAFVVAIGGEPGFVPLDHDLSIPKTLIERAYLESYKLKKYFPILIAPDYFGYDTSQTPIYYSMQYPSIYDFSPTSRRNKNTLYELRELSHVINRFQAALQTGLEFFQDTVFSEAAHQVKFNYYHNRPDTRDVIEQSEHIYQRDSRFNGYASSQLSSNSLFFRGAIAISPNH